MNHSYSYRLEEISQERLEKFRKELNRLENRLDTELIPFEDLEIAFKELDYKAYDMPSIEATAAEHGALVEPEKHRIQHPIMSAYLRVDLLQNVLDEEAIPISAEKLKAHSHWYHAA